MSAGAFKISVYQSNELDLAMPVRIQPETEGLTVGGIVNEPPDVVPALGLFAQVSKNRNAYGVGCRSVTVRWTGAVPDGYQPFQSLKIPVLTPVAYTSYVPGAVGDYLGSPIVVVSRTAENVR